MGCNASEPIHIINNVDQQLLDAQEEEKYQHKILLLGAGESGKSTVVKQIKMIWKVGGGPSDKEKQEYTLAIRRNAIEAIQTLLEVNVLCGQQLCTIGKCLPSYMRKAAKYLKLVLVMTSPQNLHFVVLDNSKEIITSCSIKRLQCVKSYSILSALYRL